MPKINFEIPVPVSQDEAFSRIKKYLKGDNDIKKFDSKVACTFDEDEKLCDLKGSQFKAQIGTKSGKKNNAIIDVSIEIPLALALFKGKIKDMVERSIQKVFKV